MPDIEPYIYTFPEMPNPEKIKNYGLPADQQFFTREKIPRRVYDLNKLPREQALAMARKDKELTSFITEQWRKRREGEWIYINGKPVYLTGLNWFYLNYFPIDIGYPHFRFPDTKEWYWWDLCVNDQNCYGGISFTRRRSGKTYRAGCILLEHVTSLPNTYCGFQSKAEKPDASDFWGKAIIPQWRRLPFYFFPIFDGSTNPKKRIDFTYPGERGNNEGADVRFAEIPLESWVDYRSSTDRAYDGTKLHRYVMDECGKMQLPANPIDMWDKVKPCLWLDGKIIGKALLTSTIESMEKGGGDKFRTLYQNSSRLARDKKINELGETHTGLYPHFTPSPENVFFDQYGMPIVAEPTKAQAEYRKGKGDKNWAIGGVEYVDKMINGAAKSEKQSTIRKFPRNIKEAFHAATRDPLFDVDTIEKRLEFFWDSSSENGYPSDYPMTFGYMRWKDNIRFGDVEFIATSEKDARMHIRHLPPFGMRNASYIKNGLRTPSNVQWYSAGSDPFKLNTEVVKDLSKMSDGGVHVFGYFNPSVDGTQTPREEWETDNFVLEYLYRPPTVDEFCEDVLMICIFYGCEVFPEFNVPVVDDTFRKWGFKNYLKHKKVLKKIGTMTTTTTDKASGAMTSESFKPVLIRSGQNFIKDKGMYCPFPRTLKNMRDLEYNNFNPSDLAVSAIYTLAGAFEYSELDTTEKKKTFNMSEFVPHTYTYGN